MAEQTPETNPAQAQQPEQQPETQQPEQQTAIDLNALQSQLAAAQQLSDMQSKGDPITDLHENLAAEQKARTTYDNILRMCDDPDVRDPIKFLRAREIVHYQRFGEALRLTTDRLDAKNFYAFNPAFDK